MTQIDELERRITAAMDRIGQGVEALASAAPAAPAEPQVDPEEVDKLKTALEEERLANAQLEERVKAIREKQDSKVSALEVQAEAQRESLAKLDDELQRLRAANELLRDSNVALRQANEAGVAEPHLINKAMLAELESLRAVRAADVAESNVLIGALEPLLAKAAEPESQTEENA